MITYKNSHKFQKYFFHCVPLIFNFNNFIVYFICKLIKRLFSLFFTNNITNLGLNYKIEIKHGIHDFIHGIFIFI